MLDPILGVRQQLIDTRIRRRAVGVVAFLTQIGSNSFELLQGSRETLDDLFSDDLRRRQVGGILNRRILDVSPYVEIEAGPLRELLVGPALKPLGLRTLAQRPRPEDVNEVVEIGALQGLCLEGEVLVELGGIVRQLVVELPVGLVARQPIADPDPLPLLNGRASPGNLGLDP